MTEQKAVKGPAQAPHEAAGTVTGAQSLIKSLESAGAENIFGKVVAPNYQQVCNSAGCTTTVTGGGPQAGAGTIPGVPVSSNTLLIGGGIAALVVLAIALGKK